MIPTPDLIAETLALPVEARRLLWAHGNGCGDWYSPCGGCLMFQSPITDEMADILLCGDHAYLPFDSAAWMEAATPEGWRWEITSDRGCGIGHTLTESDWVQYRSTGGAVTCALAALRARYPVTP